MNSRRARTRLAQVTFAALLILIPAWTVLANPALQPAPQTIREGQTRFGIVEAYYRPADARDLNVGWERIIFEWAQFQPTGPDDYVTAVIPDDWLIQANLAGREVIGLLKNTPHWASGSDKLGAPPTGLDLPIDDPGNYWAAFVRRTVQYYGERWGVNHWIIYNEPDLRPGEIGWYEFDGGVQDYYDMLKVAYMAAKSVNPDCVIHLAGMAWWTDKNAGREPYLERLLEIAAWDADAYDYGFFFDVVMVHVYFSPLNVWNVIVETKGILEHYRLQGKPIWVDETNASPSFDPFAATPPDPPYHVSLSQQADFVVQAAAMSLAAGVERFAIYRLYDDHFVPGTTEPWGLVRMDGSRRPAFEAYRTVINTFNGTRDAQWLHSQRSSLVTLEQPGRTVYVMWARSPDPVRFFVEAARYDEIAQQIGVTGATRSWLPLVVPGVDGHWFALDAPGAIPGADDTVTVEGSPVMLVLEGPPRAVWIEVEGTEWKLR